MCECFVTMRFLLRSASVDCCCCVGRGNPFRSGQSTSLRGHSPWKSKIDGLRCTSCSLRLPVSQAVDFHLSRAWQTLPEMSRNESEVRLLDGLNHCSTGAVGVAERLVRSKPARAVNRDTDISNCCLRHHCVTQIRLLVIGATPNVFLVVFCLGRVLSEQCPHCL